MSEEQQENPEIIKIKDFIHDGRIDDAVQMIALFLGDSTDNNYLDRLEEIVELLLKLHGGRTVLRFLIERLIIDIPSLLENLSKKDSVLRYSFLILLKSVCENECDLFLPFSNELLKSEDPNVREAALQLMIFMAGGEKEIDDEELITRISDLLLDPKQFVREKAIQLLKTLGKKIPSIITHIIKNKVKENPDLEDLKQNVDNILKSIVSIEKIDEIVEEGDEQSEVKLLEKEESQISDKELELKKKEIEIKKKKLELEEKEKQLEEKLVQEKEKKLKLKKELIDLEGEEPSKTEEFPKKVKKKIKKEENEIIDKELELKKKEIEIKKKKLELEEKETQLEEIAIQEREKALKLKEELIEKESELSLVELQLQQKKIEEKEQKIREDELKHAEERFVDLEKSDNTKED